jgi:ABC-type lipoprotein export system ATPase subunit
VQIKSLTVDDHKCLVDFSIRFSVINGGSSTILIGENGTGKSTMLQVITQIIMSFDSDVIEKEINYSYEIKYKFAGKTVLIFQHEHHYYVNLGQIDTYMGTMRNIRALLAKDQRSIFPRRVIAFYSGYNDGLFPLFKRVERNYRRTSRQELRNYFQAINKPEVNLEPNFLRRKYNYCYDEITPIFLYSLLCGQNSYEKEQLKNHCNIHRIECIDIIIDLREIIHCFPKESNEYVSNGSTFNQVFDDTTDISNMPKELEDAIDFIDNRFTEEFRWGFLYKTSELAVFSLHNIEHLNLDTISIYNFFEKLTTLFSAKYEVYINYGENRVSVAELSEGQRQLIKVLGMLGTCKDEDCIVLMDEPDAHMNPKWKYSLKKIIDGSLTNAINTQALIATHDPLVINGVDKKYIRIFTYNHSLVKNNGYYFTKVYEPTEETRGMGIDGLLQSEYYGLKTSYDSDTSKKYEERRKLYIKLINKEISEKEKNQLRALTAELGSLPFSYNTIDFLYDDFISAFKESKYYTKEYLTFEEVKQRREEINKTIQLLFEEKNEIH